MSTTALHSSQCLKTLLLFSSRDENKENSPDRAIVLEENQAVFQDILTTCNGILRVGMGNLKSRKPASITKTENGKNREESQVIINGALLFAFEFDAVVQ